MAEMYNISLVASCEDSFGPAAQECSNRFDFTLQFEQSILTIGPSAVLLLAAPLRVHQLWGQSRKVLRHNLDALKIVACIVFIALQLTLLVLWTKTPLSTNVSVAAATLGLVDSFAICALSYTEQTRSIRPSSVICLYLFFSILFDAVQCRTLWLLPDVQTLATVFAATLALKVALFLLEIQGKRKYLLAAWQRLSPESTSGIIGRSLFWWLNELMARGFKASLSMETLYETDEELRSERLLRRIQESFEQQRDDRKHALLFSVFGSSKGAFLLAVFPRLCLIGFKFSQPFLINRVITYVGGNKGSHPESIGYGLIAATGLIYIGTAVSRGFYQHKLFRSITMIRGALVSLIFSHTLDIDSSTAVGSATLTLTSADVDRICLSFQSLHEIWGNAVEITLAIWLLALQLGVGCVGPAITVIVSTIMMIRLSNFMGPAQKKWNEGIETRVTITSDVVGSIKEVKMMGMVDSWLKAIQELRVQELIFSKKYRKFIVFMNLLGNAPALLAPVITFGISILAWKSSANQSLSVATVFTSLSIIGLIVEPLAILITSVPTFVSSLGCFERIQVFLKQSGAGARTSAQSSPSPGSNTPSTIGHGIELSSLPSTKVTGTREVMTIRGADFAVKLGDAPILKDINLQILPFTLTIVTGKVGSGKTTLLRGLLGELYVTGLAKTSDTGAAYCAQTSWLINATIRQNIIGQTPMDVSWYETVIRACALDTDFEQLLAGDQSLIGSKGLSLSGGQKHRVALARAIYSKKPVLIIDDVLSGLDWTTQSHVWNRVFSPTTGLLRKQRATVILATHTLNHLEDADNIIVLGEDGRIAEQGKYSALRDSPYLKNLPVQANEQKSSSSAAVEDITDAEERDKPAPVKTGSEKEDDLLRSAGDTSLYWYYFKSVGWLYGCTTLSLMMLEAGTAIVPQIWLKYWTEANARSEGVNTGMYFGIFAMVSILTLPAIAANIWFMFVILVPKSAQSLHLTLLRSVMMAPLSFFVSTDTGDLINRFSQDMSLVDRDLPTAVFMTFSGVFQCFSQAILIMIGAKYLAATIPVALVALYALQAFYLRTSRQMRFLDLQAKAPLYTHLLETLDGLTTIRAFGWQSAIHDSSMSLLDESQRPYYLLFCIQRWLTLVLDLFVAGSAVLLVTFGIVTPSATSASAMALALYNIIGFNSSLAHLITSWTQLETSLGAISRLRAFETRTPQEIAPNSEDLDEPPTSWPSRGLLEVKNIMASYNAGEDPALNNLSLVIRPGEKVAICGRTGSGKSSFLLALFRLLDLDSGAIVLDGIDISHVPQNVLRSRLIAIPQEPLLFPGTLRSNLASHWISAESTEAPTDDQILSALTKVSLWPAIALHGNLDTELSKFSLSQGQKQLLCLARAVLRKDSSRLLVLDEVMSAVDQGTEEMMVKVLETEFSQHTVISVVHRLHTIKNFDTVVVLDRGSIVETGPPEVLLRDEGGRFRRMWNREG